MSMQLEVNRNRGTNADYLLKKEAKGKWFRYWVILEGKYLTFYQSNKSEKLLGRVELGRKTKCVLCKHKSDSFHFILSGAHGRHLFKCESAPRRHRWITAIHQATELLKVSSCLDDSITISDMGNEDIENIVDHSENDEEVLPSTVTLVASLPPAPDTSSLPFNLWNQGFVDESKECEEENKPLKHEIAVYPFNRSSEQSFRRVSELERKQFSTLNVRSSLLDNDSISAGTRSFPTSLENGARPTNTLTLEPSYFGKSRSLNSLISSLTDTRFSRHMMKDNDNGDTEV